jgi:hypothetical protein
MVWALSSGWTNILALIFCVPAPAIRKELGNHLERYLHKKHGPGKASPGYGSVDRDRRVHAALAWLGTKARPGRCRSIARRVRLGRSRIRSRVIRLQKRRERWQRRALLSVRPMTTVIAQRIEHLIEEFGGWTIWFGERKIELTKVVIVWWIKNIILQILMINILSSLGSSAYVLWAEVIAVISMVQSLQRPWWK